MSALNPIFFTLKNPSVPTKESKEILLTENQESQVEIPAHLIQRAIQSCETKTELVVYMTIVRYALGFNRDRCTVSRRFIAKWTGLQFQNVGRGVEGLIVKGLIEKLPESNAKHGDVYKILHISGVSEAGKTSLTRNQNDYTQASRCNQLENTQGVINLITESNQVDYGVSSERLRSVINPITKNKKEDLEESSSVSEKLEKHIQHFNEAHLRRIEKRSLDQLLERFSCLEIELALEHAQKRGTISGEQLKLPLKYLATGSSMENILALLNKSQLEQQRVAQFMVITSQSKAESEERERIAKVREVQAIEQFERAFPTQNDQEFYVKSYVEKSFKTLRPSSKIARSLAILHWYKLASGELKSLASEGGV